MSSAAARASRRLTAAAGVVVIAAACGDRPARPPPPSMVDILAARGAGEAFLQQDRLEEARGQFQRLVELAPDDPAGYTGLGLIALRAGRLLDAEEWLEEARQRSPDDPELSLALARLRWEASDPDAARALLEATLDRDPAHARTLWILFALESEATGPGSPAAVGWLERVVAAEPGSLAARVELAGAYLSSGDGDAALAEVETLRGLAPDIPPGPDAWLRGTEDAARAGATREALDRFADFRSYFEMTGAYQADAVALRPPRGVLVGIPQLSFSSIDNLRVLEEGAVLAALRYAEASDLSGFTALMEARSSGHAASGMAIGDFDGDGDEDVVWLDAGVGRFLRVDLGQFVDTTAESGTFDAAGGEALLLADFDDDRRLDVYVGGPAPTFRRQVDDGRFEAVPTGVPDDGTGPANRAIAADLDQDGDLDVFEARSGPNRLLRNDGDWTFTEVGAAAGVAGRTDTRDVAFGDLDHDGDLDLVLAEGPDGIRVLSNRRGGRFEDVTVAVGLGGAGPASAVAIADIDNDGRLDILAAGASGLSAFLGIARPSGEDAPEPFGFVPALAVALGTLDPRDLETFDFDNDGWIDVGVAGIDEGGAGFVLLRNTRAGGFESGARFLPELPSAVQRVRATDYNLDGDSDLVLLEDDGALRLLRNDGANANHFIRLDLMGLGEGSRKNNRYGIGARIEVRAGDLLQVRTVTDPSIRFGLGGRLKADVIRVEWPNGVAQDMYFPGTDQDLIERQSLKGSCPLLYLWDGDGFEFVGDVMWKSALGMPLGILGGGERAYAPAFPSQEYRRLPDGAFVPRHGEYVLQLTEELWETIYVDEIDLVAVDHPDSIEVFVNERFVPPAPTRLELWRVGTRHSPAAATDGEGRDHLPPLSARDFDYVSTLRPGRFQGIAEPHELILDLGEPARGGDVVLYLTGWIYPTDASINVALEQSDALVAESPVLDVIGPDGQWRVAIDDLGFPSGKDKTVIADLRGRFPTSDRRIRIRTNLMIYWDEAFFTVDEPGPAAAEGEAEGLRVTTLEPVAADFHFRGFSREYRKGGRYGPHWFDYDSVTTAPLWRDLAGTYTRYGDVNELLSAGDDMYVVANAGDEITVRFDAEDLPELPDGWSRTLFIYTDGWVKDGDLNTATGDRVDPLPFRGQTRYPYGADERYPEDDAHRGFLRDYQTREVRPRFWSVSGARPPRGSARDGARSRR